MRSPIHISANSAHIGCALLTLLNSDDEDLQNNQNKSKKILTKHHKDVLMEPWKPIWFSNLESHNRLGENNVSKYIRN
jgi:hypothetical protein